MVLLVMFGILFLAQMYLIAQHLETSYASEMELLYRLAGVALLLFIAKPFAVYAYQHREHMVAKGALVGIGTAVFLQFLGVIGAL